MDPILEREPPRNPPLPKAVKAGAYLGMTVGWLVGLAYVLAALRPIAFAQRDTADGILIAAPVIGAAIGAVAGWLLRDSERILLITAPDWIAFKEVRWGWRTGGIVGLYLAHSYIATNSPLGFYTGSVVLVFELIAPICAALGAGIGLLVTTRLDNAGPPTVSE